MLIALSDTQIGVILGRCIQGAAGSTILASGLSLLTVASSGSERLKAVSLWGAASAVGAAAGPLVGGLLVDSTGWQGLFWIDAGIAVRLHPDHDAVDRGVARPDTPTFDRLVRHGARRHDPGAADPGGLARAPTGDGTSPKVLGLLLVSIVSVFLFIAVEKRSPAPLVDLALMRNKVLIGATLGILIGAGTINGLMFVVSLYFQNAYALGDVAARGRPGDAAGDDRTGGVGATRAEDGAARRRGDRRRRSASLITAIGFGVLGVRRSRRGATPCS